LEDNQTPRNVGLKRAQTKAFTILFNRILTRVNQDFNRDFLETLRREDKKFIERSIVRSERRRLRTFQITVDVTFSKKELNEAFAKAGIPHGQTEYPDSLIIIKTNTQITHNTIEPIVMDIAKEYGISLQKPLGDMDDMMNLTWENAIQADPAFISWVKTRYGLDRVWAVLINLVVMTGQDSKLPYYTAAADLIETTSEGIYPPLKASNSGSFPTKELAEASLFPALVDKLYWQAANRWISAHSVEPVLRHTIPLRIVHDFKHLRYEQFLESLQSIPGFSGFQHQSMTAREVVILLDYQGLDSTFLNAISRPGVLVVPSPVGIVVYIQ
ncbi:MAG: DUF2066 domain-containing protein, partial [Magnetococcales bacterium]|nr:DUF2066 domain-containing protein [Magnetococcales bacterium]